MSPPRPAKRQGWECPAPTVEASGEPKRGGSKPTVSKPRPRENQKGAGGSKPTVSKPTVQKRTRKKKHGFVR